MVKMHNGHRVVRVANDEVQEAITNGLVLLTEYEKEKGLHQKRFVIHPEFSQQGVMEISAFHLQAFRAKGYIECTEVGEPLEKNIVQKVMEKVRKSRKHKEEAPETETGTDNG